MPASTILYILSALLWLGVLLAARGLVCWWLKTSQMVKHLAEMERLLKLIAQEVGRPPARDE